MAHANWGSISNLMKNSLAQVFHYLLIKKADGEAWRRVTLTALTFLYLVEWLEGLGGGMDVNLRKGDMLRVGGKCFGGYELMVNEKSGM